MKNVKQEELIQINGGLSIDPGPPRPNIYDPAMPVDEFSTQGPDAIVSEAAMPTVPNAPAGNAATY